MLIEINDFDTKKILQSVFIIYNKMHFYKLTQVNNHLYLNFLGSGCLLIYL